MKIIVITEHNELDAYQGYIQALVNDGKEDIAPVAEVMLESMKQARQHPEHIESETDGFQTFEVQTTEYGGCEFRAEYDSETMVKLMNLMTEHRDIVEKVVRWIHSGLAIFTGFTGIIKDMIGIVNQKKEAYAEQKAQEKEVVW